MATNNPLSLNNAAIAAFQSNPNFQNFAMGGTPVNGMLGGAVRPYMPVAGGLNLSNQSDFARANSPKSYEQYVATNANPIGPLSREQYEQEQAAAIARVNNFTPDMLNMFNGGNSSGNMFGAQGGYGYGSVNNPQNTAPTPTAGIGNQNNFNFTPTPIGASGSYDTSDWASLLGGAYTGGVAGAAAGAGVNEAVGRLQELGQAGVTDYTNLARTATEGINFTPYTLTSALGTTKQTAPGVISQTLTPQQQANVERAQAMQGQLYGAAVPDTSGIAQGAFTGAQSQLGQVGAGQEDLAALRSGYGTAAQGMMGMLGGSTTDMADQLFQQQQAMRTPEQQRQQLALENRLRAQGRLGTTTAAYGGTPEQLVMAKAVQEQQAADAFTSMTQAEQMATSQQARALGLGTATSTLAQAQQDLKQGDIANAQGLFTIGSEAAQLPQTMRGQNIAQAGELQTQALAPTTQQANQLTASTNLATKQADTAATAGRLFSDVAGAGLQERLTAESASAATRAKQFDAILKSYASQGGKAGADAQAIQELVAKGVTLVGDVLMGKDGNILGKAVDFIGTTATAMWDSVASGAEMASNEVGDLIDTFGDVVEGGGEAISSAWNVVKSWWDDI